MNVLKDSEIELATGGRMGTFQAIGWAVGNPWEAAGWVADKGIAAGRRYISPYFSTLPGGVEVWQGG